MVAVPLTLVFLQQGERQRSENPQKSMGPLAHGQQESQITNKMESENDVPKVVL